MNNQKKSAVRIGIGGPVGAGKTSFTAAVVKELTQRFSIGVITNEQREEKAKEYLSELAFLSISIASTIL